MSEIVLTDSTAKKPIHISVNAIVCYHENSQSYHFHGEPITTGITLSSHYFVVTETPEEIAALIKEANQ